MPRMTDVKATDATASANAYSDDKVPSTSPAKQGFSTSSQTL